MREQKMEEKRGNAALKNRGSSKWSKLVKKRKDICHKSVEIFTVGFQPPHIFYLAKQQ